MSSQFQKSFTQQEAIPDEGIASAIEVLRTGRLHRYNTAAGELVRRRCWKKNMRRIKARVIASP